MTMRCLCACLAICVVACSSSDDGSDAGASDSGAADSGVDAGLSYRVFFDEGFGEETREQFRTASPASIAAPEIVYPETGTLVPPNMLGIDIHFRVAVVQAFEVTFAQGGMPSVVVYTRCAPVGDGCVFQPWSEVWEEVAARRAAGPYSITIRGLAGDRVTEPSAAIELELADEPIEGGLYYSSATDSPPSIRRHELGLARRSAERFLDTDGLFTTHSVSRDGTRIAISSVGSDTDVITRVFDVVTRAEIDAPFVSEVGYVARYGPEHDLLLSSQLADLPDTRTIQIVHDGSVVEEFDVGPGHSADWSPDGDRIVYDLTVDMRGFLFVFDLMLIERVDGAWQAPRKIPTPDIIGAYSPSFAPDSDWVGFTALDSTDQDATGTFAPLLVATRISDGRYVHLRRALGDVDRFHERPEILRWNPSPYTHDGRRIYWLTFSTARDCGLLPAIDHEFTAGRQVWMAAFDPEADPDDPSRPAFRVPAQRWRIDNRMGEWALTVRRPQCETDADCPDGEQCIDGFCYEAPE
ncbi:TolB family protein [Sandaracinus amylolyticus]|uniref:TolB protein n=1 Tax=Sandaracinus amylolyticus TaxID=927083 RepID=A0A0F6W734_9BACT|nr:hypothetical protein [Sandaracinus amylolyticus]AKF09098.1 tolB protein precursor [Sandaracinus amylolyticus]